MRRLRVALSDWQWLSAPMTRAVGSPKTETAPFCSDFRPSQRYEVFQGALAPESAWGLVTPMSCAN